MRDFKIFPDDSGEEKEMQSVIFLARKILWFLSPELVLLTPPISTMEVFQWYLEHYFGTFVVQIALLQKSPALGCPAESGCEVSPLVT